LVSAVHHSGRKANGTVAGSRKKSFLALLCASEASFSGGPNDHALEDFRQEISNELASGRIPDGIPFREMLEKSYAAVIKAARGKAAAIKAKGASKAVGGSPGTHSRTTSDDGDDLTSLIRSAIRNQG
jgi:hypothetical protein